MIQFLLFMVLVFCGGWGFMDMTGRLKLPEILRWILLFFFSIAVGFGIDLK